MKKSSEGDIAERIKPVEESTNGLSAVFYGRPGTGKTNLAATFPKPVLLLDILQDGTDTIAGIKGVDVIKVTNWTDTEELYWMLSKGKNRSKYKSVIVDQVTEAQDLAMKHVLTEGGKDVDDVMSKRSWGEVSGEMKTFISNYRSLVKSGKHVAFLAHERSNEGDESDEGQIDPSIGPRLMPSVAGFLCGQVSVIGNTFIREKYLQKGGKRERRVDYAMRIGPHGIYTTKVRHPVGAYTPEVVVDPSFDTIMAIVKGRYQKPVAKKKVK
jgi:phage nucleotide-binding protein